MEGILIGIISLLVLAVLVPVAYVWYMTGGGIYLTIKRYLQKSKRMIMCSIDSDCPEGYTCFNGKCIPG